MSFLLNSLWSRDTTTTTSQTTTSQTTSHTTSQTTSQITISSLFDLDCQDTANVDAKRLFIKVISNQDSLLAFKEVLELQVDKYAILAFKIFAFFESKCVQARATNERSEALTRATMPSLPCEA